MNTVVNLRFAVAALLLLAGVCAGVVAIPYSFVSASPSAATSVSTASPSAAPSATSTAGRARTGTATGSTIDSGTATKIPVTFVVTPTMGVTQTLLAALEKNDTLTAYRGDMSPRGEAYGGSLWQGEVKVPNSHYTVSDSNVRDAEVIQFNNRTFVKNKQAAGADEWFEVLESQKYLYPRVSPRATIREIAGILPLYTKLQDVALDSMNCTIYGLDKTGVAATFVFSIMGRQTPPDWQPTAEEMTALEKNAESFEEGGAKLWVCEDGYIHQASMMFRMKPQTGSTNSGNVTAWQVHIYDLNADIQISAPTNVRPLPGPTPTLTATRVPTRTPMPAPAPAQRTATAVAAQASRQSLAGWRVLLSDSFDKIANDWTTDSYTTDSGKITKKIEEGTYAWTVRSSKPIVNRDLPKLDSFSDGAVSVDARQIGGAADCAYGMTVGDNLRNYYYFVVRTDGTWRLARGVGSANDSELASGTSSAVQAAGVNRLLVMLRGGELDLFVNDIFVQHLVLEGNDTRGVAGPALELPKADQECMVEFDNFEVRVPPPPSMGKMVVSGFDTANAAKFPMGEYAGDLVSGKRAIVDKLYRWELSARDSSVDQFAFPVMDAVADFTASVTVQSVRGPERAEAGLVVRHQDPDSQFHFGITNFGSYVFSLTRNGENDTLVFPTPSDAIKPGQPNELMVVANGRQFDLFINGQMVESVLNSYLPEGTAGVYASVYDRGSTAVFEFSEFELGVP